MSTINNPFPEGLTLEEMQTLLFGSSEYEIAYDVDNMNRRHDYEILRDYFAGLKRGVSRDELWAGRFVGYPVRKLREIYADLQVWNKGYAPIRKRIDEMHDYLAWFESEQRRQKTQEEINDEVLAKIRDYSPEEKALLILTNFGNEFASAQKCEKSCPKSWAFELAFNKLKTYKTRFDWDNAFILTHLGVNFKHAKNLYYALRG